MIEGKLFLYSGPSGVGKGTVRKVFEKNKKLNLGFSISYTTRKRRIDEKNGKDYFFVSNEKFNEMIQNNEFIEWVEFSSNKYGTSKTYVNKLLKIGKNVIFEIEVIGATAIKKLYPKALSIFLMPPSLNELEARLRQRKTENSFLISQRLEKAKAEIKLQNQYDLVVVNDDINKAAKKIEKFIIKNTK